VEAAWLSTGLDRTSGEAQSVLTISIVGAAKRQAKFW
jgi:hypothetical protein